MYAARPRLSRSRKSVSLIVSGGSSAASAGDAPPAVLWRWCTAATMSTWLGAGRPTDASASRSRRASAAAVKNHAARTSVSSSSRVSSGSRSSCSPDGENPRKTFGERTRSSPVRRGSTATGGALTGTPLVGPRESEVVAGLVVDGGGAFEGVVEARRGLSLVIVEEEEGASRVSASGRNCATIEMCGGEVRVAVPDGRLRSAGSSTTEHASRPDRRPVVMVVHRLRMLEVPSIELHREARGGKSPRSRCAVGSCFTPRKGLRCAL